MTKVKEFKFEVVITKEVSIKIPETYLSEDVIDDWESGLWSLDGESLEEKFRDIAAYAARVKALGFGDCHNDGVGKLYKEWDDINLKENPYAIIADELFEDVDSELLEVGDWE